MFRVVTKGEGSVGHSLWNIRRLGSSSNEAVILGNESREPKGLHKKSVASRHLGGRDVTWGLSPGSKVQGSGLAPSMAKPLGGNPSPPEAWMI